MKKFLLKLSIFSIIVVVADLSLGTVFKLYAYTKGGEIGKTYRIMTYEQPDLLILGSSRACHHYVPDILEDSLDLVTYNAGLDGQGTVTGYVFFEGIATRSFPKIIICEITPAFDMFESSSVILNNFYPYVNSKSIRSLITDFDDNAQYKLYSNGYRLNSAIFRLIPSIFKELDSDHGYKPSYGKLNPTELKEQSKRLSTKVSPIKEKYLRRLIEETQSNGCKLCFAISPSYGGEELSIYQDELSIINEYNLPVLNHLNDKNFIDNPNLFSDRVHLNDTGAREYTKVVAQQIKEYINK